MNDKTIFGGLVGVAAILLIFALLRPGPDTDPEAERMAQELASANELVDALTERMNALEGQIAELGAQAEQSGALQEIQARIDEVAQQVEDQAGALDDRVGDLQAQMTEAADAAAALAAQAADEARTAAEEQVAKLAATFSTPAAEPAAEEPKAAGDAEVAIEDAEEETVTFGPGQTLMLADGDLRVFVSRISEEGARLSIGGVTKRLGIGEAVTLAVGKDYCRLTLDSAEGTRAKISALCGDELPDAEGLRVGQTAMLADGNLRTFVSMVGEDSARVSLGGTFHQIAVGRSVEAKAGDERCRVYLDSVDRGHVNLSARCGADVPVSDLIGPGKTAVLGDGAARVFLTAIDGNKVRFAVNGQRVQSGRSGDRIAAGEGCAVTVEEVEATGARFGYACK